jgi:predicted transcriptional regulator
MIRLFKHYIPHAVMLLGLFDLALLLVAGEIAWQVRASQIGTDIGALADRVSMLILFAATVWLAMIAVGLGCARCHVPGCAQRSLPPRGAALQFSALEQGLTPFRFAG